MGHFVAWQTKLLCQRGAHGSTVIPGVFDRAKTHRLFMPFSTGNQQVAWRGKFRPQPDGRAGDKRYLSL